MGKLELCTPVLGRRRFIRSCVLLGVGGAVFGLPGDVARHPASSNGFVVINGWVVPTQYLRKVQA